MVITHEYGYSTDRNTGYSVVTHADTFSCSKDKR